MSCQGAAFPGASGERGQSCRNPCSAPGHPEPPAPRAAQQALGTVLWRERQERVCSKIRSSPLHRQDGRRENKHENNGLLSGAEHEQSPRRHLMICRALTCISLPRQGRFRRAREPRSLQARMISEFPSIRAQRGRARGQLSHTARQGGIAAGSPAIRSGSVRGGMSIPADPGWETMPAWTWPVLHQLAPPGHCQPDGH